MQAESAFARLDPLLYWSREDVDVSITRIKTEVSMIAILIDDEAAMRPWRDRQKGTRPLFPFFPVL